MFIKKLHIRPHYQEVIIRVIYSDFNYQNFRPHKLNSRLKLNFCHSSFRIFVVVQSFNDF